MRKQRYDIVVVGCGPSGATAGKFAAVNGAETLIIEEKRQVGFPVSDSMGILYSKAEIEESTGEKIAPATVYAKAKGLTYFSSKGLEGKPQLFSDAIFINRQLFDKSLAIGAVRAGAEIMLHSRVVDVVREAGKVKGVIVKSGQTLTTVDCSVVIAADGCFQQIGRKGGIDFPGRTANGVALGCEFAGVKSMAGAHNIDEIYLDDSGDGMYRYVVPYGQDRFTVGISFNPLAAKHRKSLKQRLDELTKHLENIGRYDFRKASLVNMMAGGRASVPMAMLPRLASDGIILVGDAAAGPAFGSRWGGVGLVPAACWTGRVAGTIAAEAAKKGDTSGKTLDSKYRDLIEKSLGGEGPAVWAAVQAWRQILNLSSAEQEAIVQDISGEVAALHFYSKGALPLRSCLEPVQNWLKERRKAVASRNTAP